MSKFTDDDIGKRVEYTDRDSATYLGTIRGVVSGTVFVDVKLDKHNFTRNYHVPDDALEFVRDSEGSGTVLPVG